jgi:hypothetical protein
LAKLTPLPTDTNFASFSAVKIKKLKIRRIFRCILELNDKNKAHGAIAPKVALAKTGITI